MANPKFNYSTHPKTLLNFDQIYKDVKLLGAGNFGETHLIIDKITKKQYSLKFMFPDKININEYYREVSSLINLSSTPNCNPSIVCYYNHFIVKGYTTYNNKYNPNSYYCILTEYIDGLTLAKYDEKYNFSYDDILIIGLWLLKTINILHNKGFVHNDISPHNIMISKDGKLKLIDFGLSCYTKTLQGYLKCVDNRLVNTQYMSPEIQNKIYFKNKAKYSKTSDVFAIGLVLYELFTGSRPYVQDKNGKIISQFNSIKNDSCINNALRHLLLINPDQRSNALESYNLLLKCKK
jgi:serine/threonine protein kinase